MSFVTFWMSGEICYISRLITNEKVSQFPENRRLGHFLLDTPGVLRGRIGEGTSPIRFIQKEGKKGGAVK